MIRIIGAAVLASCVAAGAATVNAQQTTPQTQGPAQSKLLNLNTATKAELEKLPGIGPATAQKILEYREKNGAFKKIEELMNVAGIGEKSFLKLRPLITVAPSKDGR
jgi:comEA protein